MQFFHTFFGCTFCYEKQEKTGLRSSFNILSERADERTAKFTCKMQEELMKRRMSQVKISRTQEYEGLIYFDESALF